MIITIKINTDNAAFSGNMNGETARILGVLVLKLERDEIDVHPGEAANLRDMNGNTVGQFAVSKGD